MPLEEVAHEEGVGLMPDILRAVTIATLLVGCIHLASVMLRSGSPTDPDWWSVSLALIFLWAISPIIAAAWVARNKRIGTWVYVVGIVLSGWIYENALFAAEASSTAGLIFIFMPLYQWVLVFIFALALRPPKWLDKIYGH